MLRSIHVQMLQHKKGSPLSLNKNISNVLQKMLSSCRSHQKPHQSFFLSSVSNLPIGLWATSLRQEVWKAIFALEPFTAPSSFPRHGRVPEGGATRPTWSAVSPPNPPLVVVTNAAQHWFVPRRPLTTATAWKDITIWRSRSNNASSQTPLWYGTKPREWIRSMCGRSKAWPQLCYGSTHYHLLARVLEAEMSCWVRKKVALHAPSAHCAIPMFISGTNWLTVSLHSSITWS